jgi:hypothetical protein
MHALIILAFFFVGMPAAYAILEWLFVDKHPPPPSPERIAEKEAQRAIYEQRKSLPPQSPEQQKREQLRRYSEWQSQWNRREYGFDLGGPHRQDED